jgi:hypothetical protein
MTYPWKASGFSKKPWPLQVKNTKETNPPSLPRQQGNSSMEGTKLTQQALP